MLVSNHILCNPAVESSKLERAEMCWNNIAQLTIAMVGINFLRVGQIGSILIQMIIMQYYGNKN